MKKNNKSTILMKLPRLLNPKYMTVYATIILFSLAFFAGSMIYGDKGFSTMRTFFNLFVDNAHLGISAVGMTVVLISGGIDLSVGAVAALTTMIISFGTETLGFHPYLCILAGIFTGCLFGFLMGSMIYYFKVPPFIATLAGMFMARGLCAIISRSSIPIRHDAFSALAKWKIKFSKPPAYINLAVVIFFAMIVIGIFILHSTRFGRNVYAIGGNETSAKLMGLPVGRTIIMVYTFNGLCSSLAGLAFALYTKSGWSLNLQGMELDVIAAAVIGGTLLTGGVGYVFGTLFGVMLQSLIPTFITFNGTLDSWWGKVFVGVLLLAFIGLQRIVVLSAERKKAVDS
ncbi:MAG: galactofuranose transport system permease protein [Clostridiales bacterium]|jgi:simple sugar transport system permease protein|nr:sugar ABC transporter permease YjfF [Eubacteriales bacterium]MDD4682363.1 sugar ABC transporter permease YjfF [Eubacteriales bacterium]MDN5314764.1 galactofuranose transport system permease protein [Clostridiales bacterium]